MKLTNFTLQLKPPNGKIKLQMLELRASHKTVTSRKQQFFVPFRTEKDIGTVMSTVEVFPAFERKTGLHLHVRKTSSKKRVQITNHVNRMITIPQHTTIAVFRVLISNQAKNVHSRTNNKVTFIFSFPN